MDKKNFSKWHIDKGIIGKHSGASYCEACDYVPRCVVEYDVIWGNYTRGPQLLTPYCPNCGRRMINGETNEDRGFK